ncbi:MAG TPA: VOC family protein [Thermomicrobiales bacterium]|nr:VOC family protein [Thermomicrobiales bacterium]
MESPTRPHLHHIAITVTDLEASIAWYERVFGVAFRMEVPHPGGTGKILADEEMQLVFALHRHEANGGEPFTETRTGLDHVGLGVPSRADLEGWQTHLDAQGVRRAPMANQPCTQSPIEDHFFGSILVFRDPDNVQIELFAPPSA